jgi:hypothetical protein
MDLTGDGCGAKNVYVAEIRSVSGQWQISTNAAYRSEFVLVVKSGGWVVEEILDLLESS